MRIITLLFILLISSPLVSWPPFDFQRGDINQDGDVDAEDVEYLRQYMWFGGPKPLCMKSADVNDDGAINLTDQVYFYDWLYFGGPAPAQPFGVCFQDPTFDNLTCDGFPTLFICP